MIKKIFFLGSLACLVFILAACSSLGQKAAEKAAEKAIEDSSGGKADVDINNENVNINTDKGSMQAGKDVEIPVDFPKDVFVHEGNLVTAIKSNEKNGFTLSIETNKPANEIKAVYEEKLKAEGWKVTANMDMGNVSSLIAEKDKRTVSVMVSSSDGASNIVLTVTDK